MPIDERRLLALRRYEDVAAGVSERFLEERLGPARAFAIVSEPLSRRRRLGWVIVPSVGPEHGNLRRLETLVARRLAGEGFPVIRIRPDLHPVHGAIGELDLDARLAEVDDAVATVERAADVREIGLVGTLFGGAVAALATETLPAPPLALVEPVTRGRQYVREIVRRQAVADVVEASAADRAPTPQAVGSPLEELEAAGATSVRGLLLTKAGYERISAVSVEDALALFSGRSLVVGISPTGAASPRLRKLHEQLHARRPDARIEVVQDPLVAPFGEYYYRNDGAVRVDTRLDLDVRLAELITSWALQVSAPVAEGGADA